MKLLITIPRNLKAQLTSLLLLTMVVTALSCCKSSTSIDRNKFKIVEIDTLLIGKISIRAILVDGNKIWYGADKGRFGNVDLANNRKYETISETDSIKAEYRSIAQTSDNIFLLNAGSPAQLYKVSKNSGSVKVAYSESHEKTFYDSMAFWNDKEGIAVGDPIDSCFSIIITRNGGESWQKINCQEIPAIFDGEAAFAASNSNIVLKGNQVWIVSGGKRSRVFYSADKGKNWKVFETPIISGEAMTGIFTADFYDDKIGIIAGGNYEKPLQNFGNKAITYDGGKSWKLISENSGFGYSSCIQFVPRSNGNGIVSVGASGLSFSADAGLTWNQLLTDASLYTIRFIDANTAIAAGKNKIIRIRFK